MRLGFAPPTTKMVLFGWAMSLLAAGIALMFRSEIEQFTGVIFLLASCAMLLAVISDRVAIGFMGFGMAGVAFASRMLSSFFLATEWHGRLIIIAAWGLLLYLAIERSVQLARHVQGKPI